MPVKEEPKKNETYKRVGKGNYMPTGIGEIEPKKLGDLGIRLMIDDMLSSIDGMGMEQLNAMDVSMRDVAKNRKKIEQILLSIIQNDVRRWRRQQATNGAIRLAGHLRMEGVKLLLVILLNSTHERPTLRAAAADALGLMRADDVEHVLFKHIDDPHDQVARAVVVALGKVGTENSLSALRRRLTTTSNSSLLRNLHSTIRTIEERSGLEPSIDELPPEKHDKISYTQVLDDNVVFEQLGTGKD